VEFGGKIGRVFFFAVFLKHPIKLPHTVVRSRGKAAWVIDIPNQLGEGICLLERR
jgi:hypothetical protein